jgi:anti-sigma B factor antagonist
MFTRSKTAFEEKIMMDTILNARICHHAVVIDAKGMLTLGSATRAISEKISELVASGHNRIVLNLRDVTYMDSFGIGELVACHATVARHGGELKVVNVNSRALDAITISKLNLVFDVLEDEIVALRSFRRIPRRSIQFDRCYENYAG